MPCDGIAVANMNLALARELLAAPEAITAVANLLTNLGYEVKQMSPTALSQNILDVDGYRVEIDSRGQVLGYNAPQKILYAVRDACESVAGVLTQQKVADQIAQSCQVNEQQYTSNGYLVMRVNL